MTAPGGRRRATAADIPASERVGAAFGPGPGGRRTVVVALVAVAVTLGALVLAGLAAPAVDDGEDAQARRTVTERTFSCTGGLRGSRMLHGVAGQGPVERGPVREVQRVQVPPGAATRGFAAQVARRGPSLSALTCPEPANEWWFVGAGAAVRHGTTLSIDNPRSGTAVVDVEVIGPDGPVEAPGLRGVTVAGGTTRTVELARAAPSSGEVAVHVVATKGLVGVSAADRFTLGGVGKEVVDWVPPQRRAARTVRIAPLPAQPGGAVLFVANPGQVEAVVNISAVGERGPFEPKGLESVTVDPESVRRLDIGKVFDGRPLTLELTSEQPIAATARAVRRGDMTYGPAAAPLLGTSVFATPEAPARDLVVTALQEDAAPTLVTYDERGRELKSTPLEIPARTTKLVQLGGAVRYAALEGPRRNVVAGVLMRIDPGVAAMAVQPAVRSTRLPAVSPGW